MKQKKSCLQKNWYPWWTCIAERLFTHGDVISVTISPVLLARWHPWWNSPALLVSGRHMLEKLVQLCLLDDVISVMNWPSSAFTKMSYQWWTDPMFLRRSSHTCDELVRLYTNDDIISVMSWSGSARTMTSYPRWTCPALLPRWRHICDELVWYISHKPENILASNSNSGWSLRQLPY